LIGAIYGILQKMPKANIGEIKKRELTKTSFTPKEPHYLPSGYSESLPIEGNGMSFTITYSFVTDHEKEITFGQIKGDFTNESILNDYVLKQTKEYTSETNDGDVIYIFSNEGNTEITYAKDGIWYIIRATKGIDINELKKVQQSIK